MRVFNFICLFLLMTAFTAAQEQGNSLSRGSIPEELLRPKRGESPRYPVDTVIGELGRGEAGEAAYLFASSLASGFLSGEMEHPALAAINEALRENYFSILENIEPGSFRLGGGREEADGAVSFLIRFLGREMGITGELFIRYVTKQTDRVSENGVETTTAGNWIFEDMILEEAKRRDAESKESFQRFDFSPYERFF